MTTAISVLEMVKEILIPAASITFFLLAWLNRERAGVSGNRATQVAWWLIGTGLFVAVAGLVLPSKLRLDDPDIIRGAGG